MNEQKRLAVCLGLAISQTTCGMYSTGSQFNSASSIGSPLLSGIVFLVTRLLIFWSSLACSGRRSLLSASKGDFVVPRACTATRQKRTFSIVDPSVWNGLPSDLRSLLRDVSSPFYKLL